MWESIEILPKKSTITYIENIKNPHMLIHSEGDYRFPMEQAEHMFVGLKQLMRVTEFVRFPNEGNGLSRDGKPSHRVERLRHIVRWFDHYL